MGIFSSKAKSKPQSRVTEQDVAVLKLKQQRDELRRYQKRIAGVLEKDRELARRLLAENRRERAKLLLRKKRFMEDLLQKADNQIDQLERLASDIEFKQVEMKVVDGLRVGNESLKRINAMMDIGEIEKILDETQEGYEKQAEINSLLTQFSSSVSEVTDEDLESELADMLGQEDEEVEQLPVLPEPPSALPKSEEEREPVAKKSRGKARAEMLPA